MGVPGLFANLKKKNKNIIKKKIIDNIALLSNENNNLITLKPHILFFDYNCLIHPVCHLLWKKSNKHDIVKFENELMKKSLEYLEKVLEFAEPDICGIFIDGVCPLSKMAQQRQRRFASVIDKERMNDIRKKNKIVEEEYYDTNSITPGTEFMVRFNDYINNYIKSKKDSKIKFMYSSYLEAGEGEHKIINYIKNHQEELLDKELMIYGLDADLIILSLTLTDRFNIKLLREDETILIKDEAEFKFADLKMIIFDVNECAKSIIMELSYNDQNNQSDDILKSEKYNYIHDFIFITILLGNDFIPANPTLNMKFHNKKIQSINGYDLLINTYKKVMKEINKETTKYIVTWLNDKLSINWPIFETLINQLATYEQEYFKYARIPYYTQNTDKNIAEQQIELMEKLHFKFSDPLKMYFSPKENTANYNDDNFYNTVKKPRFLHHYFDSTVCKCIDKTGITYKSQLFDDNIINTDAIDDKFYFDKTFTINNTEYNLIIKDYISTLSYIMYYYYQGCPNNLYYYKHLSGILLSDLYEYLNKNKDSLDPIMDTFYKSNINVNITPLQQLLVVLPQKSYRLLPFNIKKILNKSSKNMLVNEFKIKYLQNTKKIKRDYLNKSKLFYS